MASRLPVWAVSSHLPAELCGVASYFRHSFESHFCNNNIMASDTWNSRVSLLWKEEVVVPFYE